MLDAHPALPYTLLMMMPLIVFVAAFIFLWFYVWKMKKVASPVLRIMLFLVLTISIIVVSAGLGIFLGLLMSFIQIDSMHSGGYQGVGYNAAFNFFPAITGLTLFALSIFVPILRGERLRKIDTPEHQRSMFVSIEPPLIENVAK